MFAIKSSMEKRKKKDFGLLDFLFLPAKNATVFSSKSNGKKNHSTKPMELCKLLVEKLLATCYAINFDVEENAKERLNPRKVIHQVPSTDIRGFQIDNCVFQSDIDFMNLKSQVYYQATLSTIAYF